MKRRSYNGNENLLRGNAQRSFTSWEISEILKCKEDPKYFIRNYVYIVNLDEGKTLFSLYDFQEEIVDTVYNNRKVIIKTGRQSGKTQTMAAIILHYILFNKEKMVAVLANKAATAREILSRIQFSLEALPDFLKPGILEYNKGSLKLNNESSILAAATSSSSIRGKSISLLYLDEFAHLSGNQHEFYESTVPVISSGKTTKLVITSTPKGLDLFYKLFQDAKNKVSDMISLSYTWRDVPGRDEEWVKSIKSTMTEEQFLQEFEGEFLGSSKSLISTNALRNIAVQSPVHTKDNIKYYTLPEKDKLYVITVDTGRGKSLDYSAFIVWDCSSYPIKQVCCYKDNDISPMVYPYIIHEVATYYNNAHVLVETNDMGESVINSLHYEIEYENIISYSTSREKYSLGVRTTKKTKSVGCRQLKELVEMNKMVIVDQDTLNEMVNFVAKGSSYAADNGGNDDLVMCCVMLAWYTTMEEFEDISNQNLKNEMYKSTIDKLHEELIPFGIIDNGIDSYDEEENWSLV